MVLNLHLPPETEADLRARAARDGKTVERFILDAIEEKLQTPSPATEDQRPPEELSAEEWIARLKAWAESHPKRGYVADDSRESIYAGRGE